MKPQSNSYDQINHLAAHLFREHSGRMLAVLSRTFGLNQIDLIMDAIQDTFESALKKWKFSGIPHNPSAWLMTVAKNKAINSIKRANKTIPLSTPLHILPEALSEDSFHFAISDNEVADSQLQLLFACCQLEISEKNRIIITLHLLCGFGITEISNGLLMSDEAVKKALSRSKIILKNSGNLFQKQVAENAVQDSGTVLTILYLLFNEGYKTTRSRIAINKDFCFEALRLTRLLLRFNQQNSEANALIALMFLNLSRIPARISEKGEWLSIQEQDRNLWNKTFIEEGLFYLRLATLSNQLSRFHIEAIISSLHCVAASFEETDWRKILFLYKQLEALEPNSLIIRLNRIIAESFIHNSDQLIKEIIELESDFPKSNMYLLYATQGDLCKRMGKMTEAQKAFCTAIEWSKSPMDIQFINKKILECQAVQDQGNKEMNNCN